MNNKLKTIFIFSLGSLIICIVVLFNIIINFFVTDELTINQMVISINCMIAGIIFHYTCRVINQARLHEKYLDEVFKWPGNDKFTVIVKNNGVTTEFNEWVAQQTNPITIRQANFGLGHALAQAYQIENKRESDWDKFIYFLSMKAIKFNQIHQYDCFFIRWCISGAIDYR
ncbi:MULTISPECIES: hypothetical protein [Xenorhabdus]|uniref:hypothetical protein n=1 Tax=Xenorhabdus TaxID=626 RepID=UPI0006480911|nr:MULTISPECIES: hypothetical protein [Xenorhabdus]